MLFRDAFKLYITVSRWEFLPAVLIGILIGIFMGADSINYLLSYEVILVLIEGIIIFILLFNVGFMVNCWADWKVDELYKTKLYHAVIEMGRNKLGILVVIHIIGSIILAYIVTLQIQRIEISLLVWIGIFLGVGYPIEPFRFKKRGLLHSLIALPINTSGSSNEYSHLPSRSQNLNSYKSSIKLLQLVLSSFTFSTATV